MTPGTGARARRHRVPVAAGADCQDGEPTRRRPGAGSATFRQFADVGVNVELLLLVRISEELFYAVICADDPSSPASALPPPGSPAPGAGERGTLAPPRHMPPPP